MLTPIRLMLADDHLLVRAGVRMLLENLSDFQIVAETDNGISALELIAKHLPDIVLLDIALPGMNGLDVTERVTAQFPTVRVLLLSMHNSEEYVLRAMRLGAAGYLLKDTSPTELEMALRAVAQGESYLSPAISRHVIDGYVQRTSSAATLETAQTANAKHLSPRQKEVLKLIASGYTTKEIAQRLGITAKTADAHRTSLMKELDIHEIAGLVRYAIRIGLISAE
jgi:DNA-binding NarL/FixJ family response regulator